jgi:hypothetical protein
LFAGCRRKTVSGPRYVNEIGTSVIAKNERVEVLRAGRVSADHEFLALIKAHLLPRLRSLAGFVSAVQTFGHQTFEVLSAHCGDQVSKTSIEHGGFANRFAELRDDLLAKDLPPSGERLRHDVEALNNQKIEDVID